MLVIIKLTRCNVHLHNICSSAFLNQHHNFYTDNYAQIFTLVYTFSLVAKFGGLILIRFGLKHRENDSVALYDN